MSYRKPEVLVLGDASRVISTTCNAKNVQIGDNLSCSGQLHGPVTAAYDLDE